MSKKFRMAMFKLIDILVIFTMVSASPMSIPAAALAQDTTPALATDAADYTPGTSAEVTGSGFTPGEYVLAVNGPDVQWGVTADGDGNFVSDSPTLDSEGSYEVRAYSADWNGDWNEPSLASASFTVTAPPPATVTPTEPPTATEPPTQPPTATESPTATETPTEPPTATEPPTNTPTVVPTNTSTPTEPPTITSNKADYLPGELVTLTGANWQGDTTVTITVVDAVPTIYHDTDQVQVQADGTIIDSFNLPTTFVDVYFVTARGAQTGRVATTLFTDAPALTLTKSASTLTYTAAGQTINYSYALSNTGTTNLNPPFNVTDNKVSTITCPNINTVGNGNGTLDPGETITCTGSYTITPTNVSFGYVANTANASSSNPGATSSNPDTRIVSVPVTCRNDTAGANDVPGQKDLTQECEAPSSVNPLVISWNWDVISQPGGNSADGCALFDTDNDGLANYALCVSWQAQRTMQAGYPQLYSCSDTRSDRCTGSVPQTIQNGTGCSLELASDDPFSAGDSFPQDTKAFCSINLADVGGAQISSLIDVCSYPSAIPNSAPSDCVVISTARGNLEVIKNVVPNDTSTNWNVSWTGPTPYSTTITGSGDTGIQPVNAGSYNLSEAAGSGTDLSLYDSTWACTRNGSAFSSGSGTSITGVSVANGDVVICTFTNTRKTGTLQIKKDVVPNNPSTNWNFAITGPSASTCSIAGDGTCGVQTVFTGSYSVVETAGSGTNLSDYGTSWACTVNGSPGPSGIGTTLSGLTINNNDVVVCTFTNSQSPGTLTVNKVVVPSTDTGKFNLLIDGTVKASDVGNGGTTGAVSVSAGTHTVSETAGTGTSLTDYVTTFSGDCDASGNVSVLPNQSKTCTITNTRKGTIIVEKQTNPDGAAGSFTFTGDVAGTISDNGQLTLSNLAPGTYTSTENNPLPDFALTSIACDDGSSATPSIFDLGTRTATFKLDPGETVKCTFTNTLQQGTLTVIKQVINNNGGTATANQWSIHVKSGAAEVTGSPQPGSDTGTSYTLNPGTYNVSETGGPSGYVFTDFSGDCDGSGNVTVVPGQSKTCTLTNDDQAATLIVIKHVVNDNGGTATAANFTLDSGGANDTPDDFAGAETPGTTVTLDAGSYNVTESGPSGYSASFSTDCAGTIANGQTKTCTVTNDDIQPQLIVIKHVITDNGGSATAGDFTMSVTGTNPTPASFAGQEAPGTTVALDAGSYNVSETGPSGYAASYSTDCSGTIAIGETKTCTVTNDDQAGMLIVKKVVVNDNGGIKTASDFSFSVNGDPSVAFEADGQNDLTVAAGTYSITEPAVAGYTTTYDNCSNVVVPNGGLATCTITNNDQPGTLIVKKVVVNDNGGTKTFTDFSFQVNGGTAVAFEADGQNDLTVDAGTYTVTEPAVAGYTTTYDNCSNVVVTNGGTQTCTITNDDQAATLIVKKVVINDNGGMKTAVDFSFQVNGGTAITFEMDGQNDLSVNAGTYNIVEPAISGYTTTYDNCSDVVIPNGGSATCTITNDDQAATLIVIKHVINDNGGTATADDFSFEVNGGAVTPFEADGQNDLTVDAGSYTVTEPTVAGYATSYDNCTDVVVPNGGSATCTITNNDVSAHLTLVKVVTNDNGGTAVATDWTLSASGPTPLSGAGGADGDVDAGTYTLSETGPSGYTASAWVCSGGSQNGNQITVGSGQSATCTITNDDQAAMLIVIKHVVNDNGGTASAGGFILDSGGANDSPDNFAGDEAGTTVTLDAGSYNVTENGPSGYTASFSANCAGTIANGQTKTCTVTNDDNAPSLTLVKVVVNDNGGTALTTDFTLSADGPTPISGAGGATSDATFDAGTYDLSEINVTSYAASDWVCVGGTQNDANTVTVGLGQSVTCTITNDDIAPKLHLRKVVVNNNGGSATTADFTLTADGTGSNDLSGISPVDSDAGLQADTWALSETTMPGYTASAWSCVGGTQNGSNITLGIGEEATCTITNDDQQAYIKVVKVVTNDDGGSAEPNDFNLTLEGNVVLSGVAVPVNPGTYTAGEMLLSGYIFEGFSGDCDANGDITVALGESKTCTLTNNDQQAFITVVKVVTNDNGGNAQPNDFNLTLEGNPVSSGVPVPVNPGTYTAGETLLPGYTFEGFSGACDSNGDITVALGESKTCTLTNNDVAPTLTLIKIVVNDDGGNAVVGDFPLFINGNPVTSGVANSLSANTLYTATETSRSGYTASVWGGDCAPDGTITLNEGENKTCTITNDDVAPTLKLVKVVNNDNGGNAVANDWVLYAIASTPNDGRNFSNLGGSGTFQTVYANTAYDLSESVVAGYTAGSWSCNGGALVGSTLTLNEGETNVTCTITNDDSAPTLTLIKTVVNDDGGNAVVADFPLFINGNPTTSGQVNTLSANTLYTATETSQPGYAASTWGGACAANGTITLNEGQNATCTITNDDVAPTLKLVKVVTNDNGGDAVANDWTLSAAAVAPFDTRNFSNAGGSGVFEAVFANQGYDLSESTVPGYAASNWVCDGGTLVGSTVTLTEGENVTCTITNDDVAPQLRIVKTVVNDDGGNAVVGDFPLFIDGNAVTSGVFVPVTANAVHTSTETNLAGYTASAWGGDCAADGTITLNEGDIKTCTITNDDVAPTLKLVKVATNNNGGNGVANDWTLSAAAAAPNDGRNFSNAGGSGTFQTVFANADYDLSESTVAGYMAGSWSCDGGTLVGSTVTLTEGQTGVTCTITNNDIAPTLTLIKNVINDNGGNAGPNDFGLTIGGNPATSGVAYTLDSNMPYAINEAGLAGYTFVNITGDPECPAVLGGTVTLDEAENITCTITNDDSAPTLTLVKIVVNDDGGNAVVADFPLFINGNTVTSGVANSLSANTLYTASETNQDGYTPSAWGGDCAPDGTIILNEGDNKTCTITNDDVAPTLKLVKAVTNDNGGNAGADDWTLSAVSGAPFDGRNFSNAGGSGVFEAVFANAGYDLSESTVPGYTASAWSCDGGTLVGSTITLTEGDTDVTCTITNDDIAPTLTLVKIVVNDDGGDAVVADFPLFINGNPVTSGAPNTLSANTLYTASESNLAGYTASVWGGDCNADGTITLNEGDNKTCTITNDDVAPTLKLVKVVNNDNGGNNVADDWVLYAIASAPDDGRNFSNLGGLGDFETVYANTAYNLSESVVAGYTAGSWSCDGGSLVGSTLTLPEGETGVTCTITNDDSAPTLTLVKTVVNDDGGDAVVADFPLFIDTTQVTSGVVNTLSANTLYTASETNQPGYAASSWGGDCAADGKVTLNEGQNATCTITNDDVAPTLKLVKIVDNGDGGNAVADDWTLSAAAASPFETRNFSNPGGSGVFKTVFANQGYDLSESTVPGYTAGNWSCTGGTLVGSTVILAEGENVTCTITNDDVAPQLRIIKTVVNDDGGNAVVSDFPLFIDGNAATSGVFVPVTANTVHTATETTQPGYTPSAWGGDCAADGTITLNEGDVKTCTITNDDVAPTLKLVKEVINNNGGNAVADAWTLSADAASPFDGRNFNNAGGSGVFQTVFANAGYDLSESVVAGYMSGTWSCDGGTLVDSTITLGEGETGVTCTVTNNDVAPTLTLIKNVINDNGGNAGPNDFGLTIGGNPATSGVAYTLSANTLYAINEAGLAGYTFVDITGDPECPAVLGGTITLDEGESVACTITNDDVAPTLTLIKNVINDHGGSAQPDDFRLTIGGIAATSGTAYPVEANTPYAIDETLLPGYSFVSITGSPECPAVLGGMVTLDEGENVTCTITNNDQPATLIVIKHIINDNGGTAQASDFTLDSGGTDDTPNDFPGEEDPGTTVTLDAGAYNVTESGPSGYSASFSADCAGSIANGETKTCTVTNDDIQPQLIVIKHVINDNGGTAAANQFTMNVTGNNAAPASFPGSELGTYVALDAGSYSVGETGPVGYASSFSAACTGSIAVGETKTCTVTNDDISPTLTVIKDLLPNTDTGKFNLQIDGLTQAANIGDNGTTGPIAVDAGVIHTVGETAGTGTSLSDYVTTISGDCAADGTVTLALAENKTCTITNVRRGSIVIVKNTLGGDGTFNFTSSTLGNFSLTTSSGTASTTFSGLDPANTYDVAETVPAGWELNSAICNSGETIDSIDLNPGETVTCTFENEKAGSIVIVKNTVGGDGTFNFTSSTLGNFSLTTTSNTASTTFSNLDVDTTYAVAETVPAGWDLTSATCNGGETIGSIDLNPGETVTCTFTNTKRGHIIVDKVTLPSGDPQSFAFTTTGTGYIGFNLTDAAAPNDQILPPGVYSVTETVPAGWDRTGLSCTDPSGAPVITGNKATIDLAAGETVNCTFTNRKRGTITIIKDAVPNDAQDFAFTSTIPGAASFSLDDDSNVTLPNSKTVTNLIPGTYSVTEGAVASWDLTGLTCNDANSTTNLGTRTANITLDPGENLTCTFTNTKRGTIIVEKQTNPNGAPGMFTFTGTAAGTISDNGTITVNNLVPGTYTSTEANPSPILFALTSIICNDGGSANPSTGNLTTRTATFRLDPGETVRCVFTNTKNFHPGTIGFWRNWRNHYTSGQFQLLVDYLKTYNPLVYNKVGYPLTIAKVDAIYTFGNSVPREQMILAQFTGLKFNLAITQLDGTGGLVQKNDDICLPGVVNVSGISGAAAFFGTSTPTIQQVVNAVESKWTGKLTTNRNDWSWNLTNAQKDMLINVITGMNEGTLIMSSGCP